MNTTTDIVPEHNGVTKRIADSKTIMTEMVMPNDTNPMGNLMGGNLMRWMDIVAAVCAGRHCGAYVVTAAVDHISFQQPIRLGEVVTLEARVTRAFSTSVEVYVEVFANNEKGQNARRCNHAYFTFVAVEDDRKTPKAVPAVLALSQDEQNLYESAARRREMRLILSGRMKAQDATEIRKLFQDLE